MFWLFQFGHGLQQMLTVVEHSEIAGQNNLEWDALQVCANTLAMFAKHPQVLSNISSHYQTQEHMPQDMIDKLMAGTNTAGSIKEHTFKSGHLILADGG